MQRHTFSNLIFEFKTFFTTGIVVVSIPSGLISSVGRMQIAYWLIQLRESINIYEKNCGYLVSCGSMKASPNRHTNRICNLFGVAKPFVSFHVNQFPLADAAKNTLASQLRNAIPNRRFWQQFPFKWFHRQRHHQHQLNSDKLIFKTTKTSKITRTTAQTACQVEKKDAAAHRTEHKNERKKGQQQQGMK